MNNIRIIALLILILSCSALVQAKGFKKNELDQFFQELSRNNSFMGNVSIFRDGVEIYSTSVGYADIETQTTNSSFSKSCVGSISKMFTAVMVFQAIDEGKLLLTETLDKYYPLIENANKINIGHLLAHRSGIHNYTSDFEFMTWDAKTRDEMVDIIIEGGSDFEPDAFADYSNSGYVLLSYILETIYKKPYADLLAENITQPLSLPNTYSGLSTINVAANESNSYIYDSEDWLIQTVTDPSVTLGAGCIVSTPKDLNVFAHTLFSGMLISSGSLSKMLTIRDDYGMGIFSVPYFTKNGYGHRGGVDGFNSMLIYMPGDKISYAITSNGLNYNFSAIHIAVLNCIYENRLESATSDLSYKYFEIPDDYFGVYKAYQIPLEVTIEKNDNTLLIHLDEQSTLTLEHTSKYVFQDISNDIIIEFNPEKETMTFIKGEDVLYFKKK